MDNNSRDNAMRASDDAARKSQSPRNYNLLLRLSQKLGSVATKSSFVSEVKSFMNQKISFTPPDPLFGASQERVSQPLTTATSQDQTLAKVKKLQKIVKRSHEVLMSANTVFPFTIFPDTVTLDRTKVTITRRDFFWTSDVLSIRIEDILNVQASVGPLFGTLTIASRVMSTVDHFKIKRLWRADALRLKHIIQGYVIAQHNKIDTAHLNTKELIDTLVELGIDTN